MPNPLEYLSRPLINTKPLADMVDQPSLDRDPNEARMRGFVGGALEGLGGLTSPLSMAGMAYPFLRPVRGLLGAGKALSGAPSALDDITRATTQAPHVSPIPKVTHANRWEAGVKPKAGGVLDEVLTRAGEKSGMGMGNTPGERQLMEQFLKYPTPRR